MLCEGAPLFPRSWEFLFNTVLGLIVVTRAVPLFLGELNSNIDWENGDTRGVPLNKP